MRNYSHPILVERRSHLPPRNTPSRLLPQNTSYLPRHLADRPSLNLPEGLWEPVQRSAQRVYPSMEDRLHSADRLHRHFSGLNFDDDFHIRDRNIGNGGWIDDEISDDDDDEEIMHVRRYEPTRKSDMKPSKPVHRNRVRHEPKERLIPIEVEHVRSVPKPTCHIDRYSDRRAPVRRKNSHGIVDLSDFESSSDYSDCEISAFVQRPNLNNNAPDVKTRRARSKKRSEPYSIDLRSNSPSPETEFRYISPSTALHVSPRRSYPSQDSDIVCLSDKSKRYEKRDDKSYHDQGLYENYEPHLSRILPSTSTSSSGHGVPLHRCNGKYDLIHQDEDSRFSTNGQYQISDDDDYMADIENLKENEDVTMRSRQSSDSDEGITPTPSYPAYNIIRDMIRPEGRQVDYIRGDGNCFFRALSKVIYNTESCHEEIRQAVVDLMEKYPKKFEQFIDGKSIHDHIIAMRKNGTWGTQAEIYGAATLLQRDIYILSPDHSGKKYRWLLFSPRFEQNDVNSFDLCYITLCHTNGNHYDRIAPLVGKCNCALNPPQLSGVKTKVDLTDEEDLLIV